jgi:hypothetical protein
MPLKLEISHVEKMMLINLNHNQRHPILRSLNPHPVPVFRKSPGAVPAIGPITYHCFLKPPWSEPALLYLPHNYSI